VGFWGEVALEKWLADGKIVWEKKRRGYPTSSGREGLNARDKRTRQKCSGLAASIFWRCRSGRGKQMNLQKKREGGVGTSLERERVNGRRLTSPAVGREEIRKEERESVVGWTKNSLWIITQVEGGWADGGA